MKRHRETQNDIYNVFFMSLILI